MRQFSGFASPEETNRRYHYLLEQGQTGLSVAFDLSNLTDAGQRILKLYLYQTWGKPAKAAEWLSKLQAREEPPNQ